MSDGEKGSVRSAIVLYFPMFIAALSLITSIFNGFLNARFVDLIQRNVGRSEYMRTCKEAIDVYFQIKGRASLMRSQAERAPTSTVGEQWEGVSAVSRFAALGTYLANLRDDGVRERYSDLSRRLEVIMGEAAKPGSPDLAALFEPADRIFAEMNDDCIKSAKAAPM